MRLFVLLMMALISCGGDAPKKSPEKKEAKVEAKVEAKPVAKPAEEKPSSKAEEKLDPQARTGEQVYQQVCLSCHMVNGEGVTGAYPPLAGSEWLSKDNSVVIRIVLHGLMGEIEVKGKKYNNVMAAWGTQLNDAEVANVLTHVRTSWGNTLSPITAEEVAKVRKEHEGHGPWQASELK